MDLTTEGVTHYNLYIDCSGVTEPYIGPMQCLGGGVTESYSTR